MVSPIFLSNPSATFSLGAIFTGVRFAFLGPYILLQGQRLSESPKRFLYALNTVLLSVALQLLLDVPLIVAKLARMTPETISQISRLLSNTLNVPAISILVIHCIYNSTFDELFLGGLSYNKDASSRDDYSSLSRKPKLQNDIAWGQRQARFIDRALSRTSLSHHKRSHLTSLISTYIQITSTNIWLDLCSQLPQYGSLLVSLQVSRFFNPHIGSSLAIAMFVVGLLVDPSLLIAVLSFYKISILWVWAVLDMSYFQRLPFSDVQIANWMDSRNGMIFGLGASSHFISQTFRYTSLLVLLLEQLAVSYFVIQVTDPIPDTISEPWMLSQTVWTKGYKHGSYLLSTPTPDSPSTSSGYVTPMNSASVKSSFTNLQELTINTVH